MAMGDGGMNCRGSNNRASLDAGTRVCLHMDARRPGASEFMRSA
jgi:hypothetical protein